MPQRDEEFITVERCPHCGQMIRAKIKVDAELDGNSLFVHADMEFEKEEEAW